MPSLRLNPQTGEYEVAYQEPEKEVIGKPIISEYDQLNVRKLWAGFPVYDTSTGLSQKEGTLVIIQTNSVSRRLRVRAGNINTSVSLT